MVRRRLALTAVLLAGLATLYMLWARNSFLVAVDELRVEGATVQSEEIATALEGVASDMTTLNVDVEALDAAVARFPTVGSLSVEADFPHGLTVTVHERAPVATIDSAGQPVPVSGEAHVLEGLSTSELDLPSIEADGIPASGLLEGEARAQALVLGAAPEPLAELVRRSSFETEGVTVRLRGGVEVRFGTARRAEDKWAAAAAVLADPKLASAGYVDVRVPGRPAVGGAIVPEAEAEPLLPEVASAAEEVDPALAAEPEAASVEAAPDETAEAVPPALADPAASPEAAVPAPAPAPAPETGAVAP